MKFRDGYWGLKKGVFLRNPVELRDASIGKSILTLYSATGRVEHRGATLNSPLLTTEISSPFKDVIRIRTSHFKGISEKGPSFILDEGKSEDVIIGDDGGVASFASGALKVSLDRQAPSWELCFTRNGKFLTRAMGRQGGHMTVETPHYQGYAPEEGETFMCEYLGLSVGETVYGLGERFTHFVKNGQSVDIWNADGGTASEQTLSLIHI